MAFKIGDRVVIYRLIPETDSRWEEGSQKALQNCRHRRRVGVKGEILSIFRNHITIGYVYGCPEPEGVPVGFLTDDERANTILTCTTHDELISYKEYLQNKFSLKMLRFHQWLNTR